MLEFDASVYKRSGALYIGCVSVVTSRMLCRHFSKACSASVVHGIGVLSFFLVLCKYLFSSC